MGKTVGGNYYNQFTEPEKSIAATQRRLQTATVPAVSANPVTGPAFPVATKPEHSWEYHVPAPYQKAEEAFGIVKTAADEAEALMRIIKPTAKEFGHNLHVNPAVTSAIGAGDFLVEIVDCELDAGADGNPLEALGCPLMSSSAAFDAAREGLTLAGILGDNNPKNGKQGNHAGSAEHEGILNDSKGGKEMLETYPVCAFFKTCKK